MKAKTKKRVRALGKVLFVLYIVFIFYFLLLSDWYGRSGEMQEYHYNLVILDIPRPIGNAVGYL